MIDRITGVGNNQYLSKLQRYGSLKCVAAVEELVSKVDTNGDGAVSRDEYRAFESNTESQYADSVPGSQTDVASSVLSFVQGLWRKGAFQKATPITTPQSADQPFSKIDANGEGVIGKDESGMTRVAVHRHHGYHSGQAFDGTNQTGSTSPLDKFPTKIYEGGDGSISKDEFAALQSTLPTGVADGVAGPTASGGGGGTSMPSDQQAQDSSTPRMLLEAIAQYTHLGQLGRSVAAITRFAAIS